MNAVKFAVAAVAASFAASAASAASLSLIGSGYENLTLAGYSLTPSLNGQMISYLTGDVKDGTNGLALDLEGSPAARITYTYVGSEAANENYAATMGGVTFTEASAQGSTVTDTMLDGGLLDFLFGTSAGAPRVDGQIGMIENDGMATPASNDFAIGYYQMGSSWYALFDDLAQGDRDFDDFVLKIDVAPIPLPAAGLLLLGGLGVMGAVARRRKA